MTNSKIRKRQSCVKWPIDKLRDLHYDRPQTQRSEIRDQTSKKFARSDRKNDVRDAEWIAQCTQCRFAATELRAES